MSDLETSAGADLYAELVEQGAGDDGANDWNAALAGQRATVTARDSTSNVAPVVFETLHSAGTPGGGADLDSILDIPITLSVEIGKSRLSIRNLLQLNQGSVVELDRMAGEALDVLINGMLVAHGEVVVVNEKLGIRLTDVVSAQERVRKLT